MAAFKVKVKEKVGKVMVSHDVSEIEVGASAAIPDQAAAEAHVRKHCPNLEVLSDEPAAQ